MTVLPLLASRCPAFVVLTAILATGTPARAQVSVAASATSTRAGVYTAEQAERGKIMYAGDRKSTRLNSRHG